MLIGSFHRKQAYILKCYLNYPIGQLSDFMPSTIFECKDNEAQFVW